MTDDIGLQILAELRGLRADLRRQRAPEARAALKTALSDRYAPTDRITAAGIMSVVNADPHCALAEAVAALVNLDATDRGRSTSLGIVLAGLRCLELVDDDEHRGARVYRLRT